LTTESLPERRFLVMGLGVTGLAVARALAQRGREVVLADDAPGETARELAADLGVRILDTSGAIEALASVDALVPTPGLPDDHPVLRTAVEGGHTRLSEFDLAAAWDERPIAAVTGTNGKTTVTELVSDILGRSGIVAPTVGNTAVPLVAAIDDPEPQWFVVEASSFRLGHARRFAPRVETWLNFAPDHLDVHATLDAYEASKARIWRDQGPTDTAIANRDDPVVWSHARGPARVVSFGRSTPGTDGPDYGLVDGVLMAPGGVELVDESELQRSLPHDVANALASVATATAAGATVDAARDALRGFRNLAHRVELVGERDGVRWYDDSKATVPHAVGAAVGGFTSVVLIAGGRNKGLDLSVLGAMSPPVRAVVGIGESAGDVVAAFHDIPTRQAGTMDEAVDVAASLAATGDVVVLSPGCASFDWYSGYAARGEDYARAVRERILRPGGAVS
jgi:UDP-N-acetylmuramoylalanine--D-glutamate ligase